MDPDERRLTVDFYLCEFVFICGCLHTFCSEVWKATADFSKHVADGVKFWERWQNNGMQVGHLCPSYGQYPGLEWPRYRNHSYGLSLWNSERHRTSGLTPHRSPAALDRSQVHFHVRKRELRGSMAHETCFSLPNCGCGLTLPRFVIQPEGWVVSRRHKSRGSILVQSERWCTCHWLAETPESLSR